MEIGDFFEIFSEDWSVVDFLNGGISRSPCFFSLMSSQQFYSRQVFGHKDGRNGTWEPSKDDGRSSAFAYNLVYLPRHFLVIVIVHYARYYLCLFRFRR